MNHSGNSKMSYEENQDAHIGRFLAFMDTMICARRIERASVEVVFCLLIGVLLSAGLYLPAGIVTIFGLTCFLLRNNEINHFIKDAAQGTLSGFDVSCLVAGVNSKHEDIRINYLRKSNNKYDLAKQELGMKKTLVRVKAMSYIGGVLCLLAMVFITTGLSNSILNDEGYIAITAHVFYSVFWMGPALVSIRYMNNFYENENVWLHRVFHDDQRSKIKV